MQSTSWMLVVILLLSWGQGALAGFGQAYKPMGDGSQIRTGGAQHCQMPKSAVFQHDCGAGCINLQQALPQRDSDLLAFEHIERPVLVSRDLADLLPIRGPPREKILFFSTAPPVPIPLHLSFCCLRI